MTTEGEQPEFILRCLVSKGTVCMSLPGSCYSVGQDFSLPKTSMSSPMYPDYVFFQRQLPSSFRPQISSFKNDAFGLIISLPEMIPPVCGLAA